jgi:hypothetical protein
MHVAGTQADGAARSAQPLLSPASAPQSLRVRAAREAAIATTSAAGTPDADWRARRCGHEMR